MEFTEAESNINDMIAEYQQYEVAQRTEEETTVEESLYEVEGEEGMEREITQVEGQFEDFGLEAF